MYFHQITEIIPADTQSSYMRSYSVLIAEFRHALVLDEDSIPVPYDDQKSNNKDMIAQRYSNYLNGPMGRNVMDNVEEGDSFMLETSKYLLRVTKVKGKAIVDIIKRLQ
jgi:hypothetical protein